MRAIAALMLIACACGGGGGGAIDAAPADAPSIDAPPIDAPTDGAIDPAAAVLIRLHRLDADGDPHLIEVKERDGTMVLSWQPDRLTFYVPIGEHAQVALREYGFWRVITDVMPGDELLLGVPPEPPPDTGTNNTVGTMSLTFPRTGSSTSYAFETPCGWQSPLTGIGPMSLQFHERCQPDEPFDVVGVWWPANAPAMSLVIRDVTFTPGGTITAGPWEQMPTVAVTLRGLDPAVNQLRVRHQLVNSMPTETERLSRQSADVTVMVPALRYRPGDARLVVKTGRSDIDAQQAHHFMIDAEASAVDLDLSAWQVPWVPALGYSAGGDHIAWTQVGGGNVDVAIAARNPSMYGCIGDCVIFGPGTGARIHLPGAGTSMWWQVMLIDDSRTSGYADVKRDPNWAGALPVARGDVLVESVPALNL